MSTLMAWLKSKDTLITQKDLAEKLNRNVSTIYRRELAGELPPRQDFGGHTKGWEPRELVAFFEKKNQKIQRARDTKGYTNLGASLQSP